MENGNGRVKPTELLIRLDQRFNDFLSEFSEFKTHVISKSKEHDEQLTACNTRHQQLIGAAKLIGGGLALITSATGLLYSIQRIQ